MDSQRLLAIMATLFLMCCQDVAGQKVGESAGLSLNRGAQVGGAGGSSRMTNPNVARDDRLDLSAVTNPNVATLFDSTVALMHESDLSSDEQGNMKINGQNFGESYNLCPGERFADQDFAAFCSGSLIGPDLILTAGHCVTTEDECASTRFVFGFEESTPGLEPRSLPPSEVYSCAAIIHREEQDAGADFAIIKLDRPVVGHTPLPMRTSGEAKLNDAVIVIGFPVGLPAKVAAGNIRKTDDPSFYVTNLDTYGGNSGSAVFDANTGLIEGVLVRGENDFVETGGCVISNHCTQEGCRGEDVTKIDAILPYLGPN
jgi:hypothetical protein